MRSVLPPISFVTGAISRSNSSPWARSTTGVSTLWARPVVVVGKLSSAMGRCSFERGCFGFGALGDPIRDELCVVLPPADERGSARVLPGKAEERGARDDGDAASVGQLAVGARDRQLDPRMVEP